VPGGGTDEQVQWEPVPQPWQVEGYEGRVMHIIESALNPGEYRISRGGKTWVTHNDFRGVIPAVEYDAIGTHHAIQSALGPFANYAVKYSEEFGEVRRELDNALMGRPALPAYPVPPTDHELWDTWADDWNMIQAISAHIREEGLWAVTRRGRALYKGPGSDNFTDLGQIPLMFRYHESYAVAAEPVPPHPWYHGRSFHMMRDGAAFLTLYVGGWYGLYKTWDGGLTWRNSLLYFMNRTDPYVTGLEEQDVDKINIVAVGYGSPQWVA
jgi:hypothetical protein